jgi:hypothetical protein
MQRQREEDLERHSKLSFRRMKEGARLIKRFHALPERVRQNHPFLSAYEWLLVPMSLWPVDVIGVAGHLLDVLESGKKPTKEFVALMELIGRAPDEKTCGVITQHERDVEGGSYESLIKAQHKFDFKEQLVKQYKDFRIDWNWIKKEFNVKTYQGANGVIRRRMVSERNFRPKEWNFKWTTPEDRFRNIFDAFCHKWVLYGMEGDNPLLQKLSVNITPFGTMIFIPRYWSIDRNRDLRWRAISRLHRARGVPRQGAKLSANQVERRKQAEAARTLLNDATAQGMRGEARTYWVMAKLGMHPDTDPKQLHRLLKVK